jgi:hypothetical protein
MRAEPRISTTDIGGDLLYYSQIYMEFLQIAVNAQDASIYRESDKRVIGKLPLMEIKGSHGVIANSLPFFGSHGGPICNTANNFVRKLMLNELENRIDNGQYVSVTLIENPFFPLLPQETDSLKHFKVIDERISQVTQLILEDEAEKEGLLACFHEKTRNSIRKGLKQGFMFEDATTDQAAWTYLIHEHYLGISRLGGLPKNISIFENLKLSLAQYLRLHVARDSNGRFAAALLSVWYGGIVEYFVPVVTIEYRESQALSALIFEVMKEAYSQGFKIWNWGGTWLNQKGVYNFKKRFGAVDRQYRYFHWSTPQFKSVPRVELEYDFPYWYSRKFD